jgi:hypothetical protein
MEHIFVESIEKHRQEVSILRLNFMVSQRRNNTHGQIFKKAVWSIQGTILLTQ